MVYPGRGLRKAVVSELPLPVDFHEAGTVEVAEVTRDGGLRKSEQIDQVSDAEPAGVVQVQDPDPGGIGKAAEQVVLVGDGVGSR